MAFQLKNFVSIAAAILNRFRGSQSKVTDFNVGAVGRTMFEAVSTEIDELYQQLFNGLMEGIAVSVFNSFNFSQLPAVPASGLIQVTITPNTQPVLIPAGTVFSNPSLSNTYVTQTDATIAAGDTQINVLAVASVAGSATNLNADVSFTCGPSPTGFVSAANVAAFLNGADLETDPQRKQRFNDFISNLARGTVSALEFGAKTTVLTDSNGLQIEKVALVQVIEPYVLDNTQPIAIVDMYIHNGVGNTSSALVAQCTQIINGFTDSTGTNVPGYKAAGIPVNISPATEVPLDVTGYLSPQAGFDGPTLAASAQEVLGTYLVGLGIGAPFVFSDAIVAVKAISGVGDFVFVTPSANDAVAAPNDKFMPGTFSITPTAAGEVLVPTAPTNSTPPQITGLAEVGQELTYVPGVWAGFPPPTVTLQWNANGTPIAGQTGTTYQPVAGNDGAPITITETAVNSVATATAVSAATAAVIDERAPVNDTAPVISGPPVTGVVLTAAASVWEGGQPIAVTRQWNSDGVAVSEATGNTYTPQASDLGNNLTITDTATSTFGTTSVTSAAVGPVTAGAPPVNTTAPSITGVAQVGDVLTANIGVWTANPAPEPETFVWLRSGAAIAGATASTYQLQEADLNATIEVQVTATNQIGHAMATSAATAVVVGAPA